MQTNAGQDVRCDGVENRGVEVDGVKQRSCWRAECRGHGSLSAPMCPPWSYPWSWAMCNKSAFTAIQKRLQSFFASFAFLCPPFASRASHHSTWKPILFHTTRLQAYMLHTTCPASFTPRFLQADFPSHHAACKPACFTPLIMRASHHTFWKPVLLHTTHPASRLCFTPHVLQACTLHTIHAASFTPHALGADFASHHMS